MIHITGDSAWDMPREYYDKLGLEIVPVPVIFDGAEHLDDKDFDASRVFKSYRETGKLPKTAGMPPSACAELFERKTANGDEVIHFAMSSGISSATHQSLKTVERMKGVYIIDSHSLSTGISLLALKAVEMRDQGMAAKDIVAEIEKLKPKVQCSFVINTLEWLHKGGRCSGLARFASVLLKIKPTIVMIDGVMQVGKKYMKSLPKAVMQYVADAFERMPDPDLSRIFITHTLEDFPELLPAVKAEIAKHHKFAEVIDCRAHATISCHCGPNTLGILYLTK